jgi:membrane peptidoglycan carboxypeptidase
VNKKVKNRRGIFKYLPSFKTLFTLAFFSAVIGLGGLAYAVKVTPIPQPNEISQSQASIFYYDDGITELGRLGEANRESITIEEIPLETQHAVLAAEDREFYNHGGFSVRGISRALINNLLKSSTQGGSTITQQYAKNAYLSDERRIKRKVKELVLSMKLETVTSKERILEDYLNAIYFGRGAYGIETGAQQYFGKSVRDLSVSESAVLAAIIQAPSNLDPDKNIDGLKNRWNYVLDGMVAQGWLDGTERDGIKFPAILPYTKHQVFGGPKGYLLEQARQEVYKQGFTEDDLNRAGLRITTTFNKQAQDAAEAAVIEKGPQTGTEGLRIGLASVRPGTGEVVALYGGADYLENQVNNATQAIGQAGSTFKPFTLAAALEAGKSLATTYSGKNKTMVDNYEVVNYSGKSFGARITLLKATENSVNSAYVQAAKEVGLEKVVESAIRAGLPSDTTGLEPNLAATLGTSSPHPVDIAGAYATFAARGLQVRPTYLKLITDRAGNEIYAYKPLAVQAFSTDICDIVNYALQKVVSVGTGRAAKALGRPAAGKTGTTNDNKSAWFAGFTPELATAVMFVKDGPDGQPVTLSGTGDMSTLTGGSFPARIWTAYMKGALDGIPVTKFAPLPTGVPNGANPTDSPSASAKPTSSSTAAARVTVPDLSSINYQATMSASIEAANTTAATAGFSLTYQAAEGETLDESLPLYVVSGWQSPAAGTKATSGSTITVRVTNTAP